MPISILNCKCLGVFDSDIVAYCEKQHAAYTQCCARQTNGDFKPCDPEKKALETCATGVKRPDVVLHGHGLARQDPDAEAVLPAVQRRARALEVLRSARFLLLRGGAGAVPSARARTRDP